jgi:Raf kinase inhibitor-like YbhB/YbcL family protein
MRIPRASRRDVLRRGGALLAAVALCLAERAPARGESFTISSPAFRHGAAIPRKYTCDRANVSPPLRWQGVPAGTRSFAVVAEDPDVPVGSAAFWILYDLPGVSRGVRQAVPPNETLPGGARQGVNDLGRVGYGAPCPPPGRVHHYYFRVYALDAPVSLAAGATKKDTFRAIRRHILRVAELMGTYERGAPAPDRERQRRRSQSSQPRTLPDGSATPPLSIRRARSAYATLSRWSARTSTFAGRGSHAPKREWRSSCRAAWYSGSVRWWSVATYGKKSATSCSGRLVAKQLPSEL